MSEYVVDLNWDEDAAVWVATSDDIVGLVLESGSLDALIERVRVAAAELLTLNSNEPHHVIPLHLRSERYLA
jgi:hypothetical protein